MKTTVRNCPTCSKVFYPHIREVNRGNGRFCSIACGRAGRQRKVNPPNKTCAFCSKEFYRKISAHKLSKSGIYFCSRACKNSAASPFSGVHIPEVCGGMLWKDGSGTYRNIKKYRPVQCERCGYSEHPIILVVHHKDRDRLNNDTTNLEVLCPNCHAIEHRVVEKPGIKPGTSILQG